MVLLREEVCVWAHATTPWSLMSYTGLSNMCYVASNGEIHLQRWKRWETVTDEPRCFRTVLSKPSWRRDADPANERVHLSAHHDILLSCLMTLPCDSTINTNSKQTVCQGSLSFLTVSDTYLTFRYVHSSSLLSFLRMTSFVLREIFAECVYACDALVQESKTAESD